MFNGGTLTDNATNVILNVHMQARPGHEEDLHNLLLALVEPTRAEPGRLIYELHRDPADSAKFMFYERFTSQKALDWHTASPQLTRFREIRAASNPDPLASQTVTKWKAIA